MEKEYDCIIVGAGASGMMAGIIAARRGKKVCMLEKTASCGNKINITGKGRCNVTFDGDTERFKNAINTNAKFMYSSFNMLNNYDLIEFLKELNIEVKLERGNRYFLASDNARDLSSRLKEEMKKLRSKCYV